MGPGTDSAFPVSPPCSFKLGSVVAQGQGFWMCQLHLKNITSLLDATCSLSSLPAYLYKLLLVP